MITAPTGNTDHDSDSPWWSAMTAGYGAQSPWPWPRPASAPVRSAAL